MVKISNYLSFESPVVELEGRLEKLESLTEKSPEVLEEILALRKELSDAIRKIYGELTPWQTVQVARHPERPQTGDYLNLVFDEFVELHGDKAFGDDRAMLTGFAKLDEYKVMVVGQHKGKTPKERIACNFGMAHPEGYRKSISKMKMAAKYGMPIITLIDTSGAYPGIGAEERGQARLIAEGMYEMSRLNTPIICVVIGEGGSGGALGIGVGDRVAMLQHACYSVISPEGCAGILWKSRKYAEDAAKVLRITSKDLLQLGVVDHVIEEPLGGADRDHPQMAGRLKMYLLRTLRELTNEPPEQLLENRYQKFRKIGVFLEGVTGEEAEAQA